MVPSANGDAKVVVSYREIERALDEGVVSESISRFAEAEGPSPQRDEFLANFAQALRRIELEEEVGDPEVMTVPRDRTASLALSLLAEEPPEGSSFEELAAGGAEVVFSNRDIGGWLRSLFDWVGRLRPHPLLRPAGAEPVALPNQARVALLGDWGTGLYGAVPCAESIRRDGGRFDLLMHLGDVYYSGTRREVRERFLNVWPFREDAVSRSINSNHEMYSGGHAYFEDTLPTFGQGSSYFALQNDHWLLVGLDVAYLGHDIDAQQVAWLEEVIAGAGDRKVLLFSHHQLFSRFDGKAPGSRRSWAASSRRGRSSPGTGATSTGAPSTSRTRATVVSSAAAWATAACPTPARPSGTFRSSARSATRSGGASARKTWCPVDASSTAPILT